MVCCLFNCPRTQHTIKEYASPYEAMFGVERNRGIVSSFLPGEQIANIETEELEEIANTFETEVQLEETVNTFEENLSSGHNENHIP